MEIKIQYFGLVGSIVGREYEQINVASGACVKDVFQILIGKYSEEFSTIMFRSDGTLRPSAMVVVNGKDIRDSAGLETKLNDDCQVFLSVGIYPVAGG